MKTGIGSGIEFQPESEIESIFVFSIVEIIEVFNICFDFMKLSKSIIKYYPSGLNGLNWLKVNGNKYYQCEELENGMIREIECDIEEKWMKVRERKEESEYWNEIDLDGLKHHDIIDLNENGDRWEGDSLQHNPFGYGCLYNSENQLIYSGFIFEGLKVCYGVEMYGDVGLVEYEGEFYKGMRYSNGNLYDKKNELIYKGEWYMNNPMNERRLEINGELKEEDIHFGLEEIIFDNLCKSDVNRMCFVNYPRLKRLVFHKISMSVEEFRIENCDELIDIQLCKDSEDNEKEEDDKEMPSFILYSFIGFINPDNDRKFKINCNTCKLISNNIL